ncbi:unnamed protein product [Euphydryas editha]|uniref:Uncharacterized protein n=1 Tax=Euphydryas editha TaxID=104508 RepID=A0AAU9UKZ0_EUPED|nr:unnamed protein product [Euphydryas editha]
MNIKEPNSRLTRWRLKLSEFDFSVVYKQGKCNTNADALSRIEIHNEEVSSIIANPSEKSPSLIANSNTDTVHTDSENPILEVPITDFPLNKYHKQIVLTLVDDIKSRPSVSKPFESHIRTHIQISKNNIEEDVINAIKEYVNPKVKTGILINPPLAIVTDPYSLLRERS